jgi:hypothetical protein
MPRRPSVPLRWVAQAWSTVSGLWLPELRQECRSSPGIDRSLVGNFHGNREVVLDSCGSMVLFHSCAVQIRLVLALLSTVENPRDWSPGTEDPHMLAADAKLAASLQRIRSEYLEIPGLHLTKPQVQRLWGLDPIRCDALLETLIEAKFLKRTLGAQYVRADAIC